jgi:hypothetical protein
VTNLRYWPFVYGHKSKANAELQRRLGFSSVDADGIFGAETRKALQRFQQNSGLPVTGEVDRATEDLLFPGNFERRTPSMQITSNWLSGIVTSTGFKYILTALATLLASRLGLDQGNLVAILTQIAALIPALWGMWEAAKSKVVVNGQNVNLANVSAEDQARVAEVVAKAKGISVTTLTK